MDVVIERLPRDAGIELSVCGRLDAESAGELRLAVSEEVRRGRQAITLDLAAVTFLSSAGIRVLFETQREARRAGGDCIVTAASDPVRKVLELTRLDTILMRQAATTAVPMASPQKQSRDIEIGRVRLIGLEAREVPPLRIRWLGATPALTGDPGPGERLRLEPTTMVIGLAAISGDSAVRESAGESLAACGAMYHRPPRPFAMVDYVLGTGDLVPEIEMLTGVAWEGVPACRGVFEPASDAVSIGIDDLVGALLEAAGPGPLAVVFVGDVHGLVAAELIRPLAEATPIDHPLVGTREAAARWLSFSREPIHAGRTAMIVGIVAQDGSDTCTAGLAPIGTRGVVGHLHAVVFPHRPTGRTAGDIAKVVADLATSEPIAVVHLMTDDRPVLGDGLSHLVRGSFWVGRAALSGDPS